MPVRNRELVSPERLGMLNRGLTATTDLMEGLCVDFAALLEHVVPGADGRVLREAQRNKVGIVQRMHLGAAAISGLGPEKLAAHASDTVRGWACFALLGEGGLTFRERLRRVRVFAADSHFGVREWAWMALRPHVAAELTVALRQLEPWTRDGDASVRRFASEVTRPRGVWCAHLTALKDDPTPGLRLLEPLRADPSKYVRLSVGNWLNDAAKSRQEVVKRWCQRWTEESDCEETRQIVSRGLRSV